MFFVVVFVVVDVAVLFVFGSIVSFFCLFLGKELCFIITFLLMLVCFVFFRFTCSFPSISFDNIFIQRNIPAVDV